MVYLDLKLALFNEQCDQANVPMERKNSALSALLSGSALNFYSTYVKSETSNMHEMIAKIRSRFVTSKTAQALTREWDSTSLDYYEKKNPDKSLWEVLDLMIKRLHELHVCMPRVIQNDEILKHFLLNACDGFEPCRFVRKKVAPTLMEVIVDIQNSVSTYIGKYWYNNSPSAMMIDRKRRFSNNHRRGNCFRGKPGLKCKV